MSDSMRTSMDDCAPVPDPADQPHLPDPERCQDPPATTIPDPAPMPQCPTSECKCETPPTTTPTCLDDLIRDQAITIAAAEKAKAIKTELEALLAKAKTVNQEYTQDNYQKLVKQWIDQDIEIAHLVRKLVCALPCWKCVIECYVCPLLHEIRQAEYELYGDGALQPVVRDLWDKQYWSRRDKEIKERAFDRVKRVLAAWEKPAQTIEKVMADDAKLIADIGKALNADPAKVVYDLFLRLIPMHLAVAPPKGGTVNGKSTTTRVRKEFTEFCDCHEPTPNDCCGPDIGPWGVRQRLIEPQPYLVEPARYLDIICCLVKKQYGPAYKALSDAEAALITVDNRIKANKAKIDDGLKNFEKNAKGAIPANVSCSGDEIARDDDATQAAT